MRYGCDHKAQTRERVLREAAAAIRAEGPDKISVAALMRRAGLTHGGFYAHWPSKDALLADAVDHMFTEGAGFCADAETLDPRVVLHRYVAGYLSMAHRDGRAHGCPVPILAGEQHRLPEAARLRFCLAVTRMRERLAGLLDRAGIDDAQARAASAIAEMVGSVGLARITEDRAAAEALLGAARASVTARLGLAAPLGTAGRSG